MKNSQLLSLFKDDPIKNVFPLYILDQHPEKQSITITSPEGRVSAAINGMVYGNFEVFSYWLHSYDEKDLRALLSYLANGEEKYINCDLWYKDALEQLNYISDIDVDLHFIRKPKKRLVENSIYELVQLDIETLPKLNLSEEIKTQIGSFTDFPVGSRFWGLVDGNEVIALADGLVRYQDIVSISQVYTLKSRRGQGLGKEVVSRVTNLFNSQNCTVTYLVSQNNTHSVNLAKGLGFELYNESCFAKVITQAR